MVSHILKQILNSTSTYTRITIYPSLYFIPLYFSFLKSRKLCSLFTHPARDSLGLKLCARLVIFLADRIHILDKKVLSLFIFQRFISLDRKKKKKNLARVLNIIHLVSQVSRNSQLTISRTRYLVCLLKIKLLLLPTEVRANQLNYTYNIPKTLKFVLYFALALQVPQIVFYVIGIRRHFMKLNMTKNILSKILSCEDR